MTIHDDIYFQCLQEVYRLTDAVIIWTTYECDRNVPQKEKDAAWKTVDLLRSELTEKYANAIRNKGE